MTLVLATSRQVSSKAVATFSHLFRSSSVVRVLYGLIMVALIP